MYDFLTASTNSELSSGNTTSTELTPNNDFFVVTRRNWVAEQYYKGYNRNTLFNMYNDKWNLSIHSLDKDITAIKSINELPDVKDCVQDIINDQYRSLESIKKGALEADNPVLALQVIKETTNLLKLVMPHGNKGKTTNIQVNAFGDMSPTEIFKLLGRS